MLKSRVCIDCQLLGHHFCHFRACGFLTGCQEVRNPFQMERFYAQAFSQMSSHCLSRCPQRVSELSRCRMGIILKHVGQDLINSNFWGSSWSRGIGNFLTPSLNFRYPLIDLRSLHCSIIVHRFQSAMNFLRVILLFHQEFDDVMRLKHCGK
jgi:hypothetical protein